VGSLVGLIVLGLAWELWLAPLRPGGSLLALKVLPLVRAALRAVEEPHVHLPLGQPDDLALLHRGRGARLERHGRTGQVLALVEVLLCLVLFAACACVRLRLRHATPPPRLPPANWKLPPDDHFFP
jgi:hypothetical protein